MPWAPMENISSSISGASRLPVCLASRRSHMAIHHGIEFLAASRKYAVSALYFVLSVSTTKLSLVKTQISAAIFMAFLAKVTASSS